jgi:hypothetical protein
VLQGEETGFYNTMEVSVIAHGGDGAINGHREGIDWLTGMWDVAYDRW